MIVFPVLIPVQNFLFPGTGRENLKCHGKGRDGKFEACIPGNHGKREFPLTPVNRVEEQDCRWPRTPTTINSQQSISQFETHRMIQIQKNDSDLKKLFRSQNISNVKLSTLVLKGYPPDLSRSPGLVSIRTEGT